MYSDYDTARTPLEIAQTVSDWNDRDRTPTPERDAHWGELLQNMMFGRNYSGEFARQERSISPAYHEAQKRGQHVVFVCAQGQERSVAAAEIALKRGEEHTSYLAGGFYSFGEQIKSQSRNRAKAELGFFHREPNKEEGQILNRRVDELAFPQLQTLMIRLLTRMVGGDPRQHAYLRIFYDERSHQADEFMRVLDSLQIPYETVTSPQMSVEIKRLKAPSDNYDVAGHNWLNV